MADDAHQSLERAQLVLLLETFTRRVSLALGEEEQGQAAAGAADAAVDASGCESDRSAARLDAPHVQALLARPASEAGGHDDPASASAAQAYFEGLRARVAEAQRRAAAAAADKDGDSGAAAAHLLWPVLCAGVRCLRAFVALAVTGPARTGVPSIWVDAVAATDLNTGALAGARGVPGVGGSSGKKAAAAASELGRDSATAAERWVAEQLRADGEDLETRVPHLDLLLAARECLVLPAQQPQQQQQQQQTAQTDDAAAAAAASASIVDARLPTWHWWALRLAALHQQVLSGRAASLHALAARSGAAAAAWARALQQQQQQQQHDGAAAATTTTALCFATAVPSLPASTAALLCACAHLEFAAAAHHEYGYVELAQAALARAAEALGVQVAVYGALGRRTVHQADAKAQLVARVRGAEGRGGDADEAATGLLLARLDEDMAALGLETLVGSSRETEGVREDGAVYLAPRLQEEERNSNGGGGASADDARTQETQAQAARAHAHPAVEQALLLGWAAQVEKRGRSEDDLSRWEAAPYVEAVLREPRSQPALQLCARLLKARHEAARGRTRERALMTLEALADYAAGAPGAVSALAADTDAALTKAQGKEKQEVENEQQQEKQQQQQQQRTQGALSTARLPFCFTARQPLLPTLRQELAAAYVALGLPGPALELYERLEAWDALIICYRLLGKSAAARELIQARLSVTPGDPSLLCALGDLAEEAGGAGGDRHYEEAWRASGGRSARAKRSLARSALRRRDYSGAAAHYEDALALSPMHAQAWFSLGYCRLREAGVAEEADGNESGAAADAATAAATTTPGGRFAPALRAFSRVTLLDPQHGEAWANLAALWLRAGRPREALSAAEQAVKHKREAWQAWENYAAAALQCSGVEHLVKAARALREVLSLSRGERLPGQLAEGLVAAVEEEAAVVARSSGGGGGVGPAAAAGGGEDDNEDDDEDDDPLAASGDAGCQDPVQATEALLLSLLDLTARQEGGGEEQGQAGAGEQPQPPPASGYDRTEASAAVRQRQLQQLLDATSAFLRDAALAPACAAATWALVARVKALRGEQGAAREAWVKACRGLAGDGAFRSDASAFSALAEASARYCLSCARAYRDALMAAAEGGAAAGAAAPAAAAPAPVPPPVAAAGRDLAACRMHLRSVMKQCEERFSGEAGYRSMASALEEVVALEEDVKARRAAAKAEE
jgi:hypothetical protein